MGILLFHYIEYRIPYAEYISYFDRFLFLFSRAPAIRNSFIQTKHMFSISCALTWAELCHIHILMHYFLYNFINILEYVTIHNSFCCVRLFVSSFFLFVRLISSCFLPFIPLFFIVDFNPAFVLHVNIFSNLMKDTCDHTIDT